ncbi:MAG: hypothetical protein CMK32_09815 [Porticoccaceae bacterium]|nr:hypothetical protein [Porticoccaceae bacterium]
MQIETSVSVREPYAHLLVSGLKKVENRSIPFPSRYKLPTWVAVHASQSLEEFSDVEHLAMIAGDNPPIADAWGFDKPFPWEEYEGVPDHLLPRIFGRSEIIGAIEVVATVPFRMDSTVSETFAGFPDMENYEKFAVGEHCWIIGGSIRFKHPIVTLGHLGVRNMKSDVAAFVRETAKTLLTSPAEPYGRPVVHRLPSLPKRELLMYQADVE